MSGEWNDNVVREFTYFIASVYRPATIETMFSDIRHYVAYIACWSGERG